jgi:hypothetical protein
LNRPIPIEDGFTGDVITLDAAIDSSFPNGRRLGGGSAPNRNQVNVNSGYLSNLSAGELAADKFNQYLKEEGLDTILALRARRKETGVRAHELFSRCAKSLVFSGSSSEAQGDRSLGFTLELLAERDPYTISPGEDLLFA